GWASSETDPRPTTRPLWASVAGGASMAAENTAPAVEAAVLEVPLAEAPLPVVLGQHRLVYIVASDGEELVLVDQHTAHERVRFERLQERAGRRLVESQRLLEPQVVAVPPELGPLLDSELPSLLDLGFDAEPFGGRTLRIPP